MMQVASNLFQAQKRRNYIISGYKMRTFHHSLWVASAMAVSRMAEASFAGSPPVLLEPPVCRSTKFQAQCCISSQRIRTDMFSSTRLFSSRRAPPDFTIDDNEGRKEEYSAAPSKRQQAPRPSRPRKPPIRAVISTGEASWMDRNARFTVDSPQQKQIQQETQQPRGSSTMDGNRNNRSSAPSRNAPSRSAPSDGPPRSFRDDFRGTRVFVSGLPEKCSWQTLKDHFRVAGEVVFASVSFDRTTGRSKEHGIVQFETTEQAANAIAIMRNHPLQEHTLFVRPDVQEDTTASSGEDRRLSLMESRQKGPTPPSKWKCANSQEDAAALFADGDRHRAILQTLKARDQARFRRNYAAGDTMREELKREYGVHIDDRNHLWWTAAANEVPGMIRDLNGDGRWGSSPTWRQIPTTTENDACVDPDLVEGLLKQRDVSRREKDFAAADRLLEMARTAPDNGLTLRIHDESRTWRIWTEGPPPPSSPMTTRRDARGRAVMSPEEECIELVEEYEPEKLNEVQALLAKFPGREYNILKKIKHRYLQD